MSLTRDIKYLIRSSIQEFRTPVGSQMIFDEMRIGGKFKVKIHYVGGCLYETEAEDLNSCYLQILYQIVPKGIEQRFNEIEDKR